jgi:hypothetical protein
MERIHGNFGQNSGEEAPTDDSDVEISKKKNKVKFDNSTSSIQRSYYKTIILKGEICSESRPCKRHDKTYYSRMFHINKE